MRPCIRNIDKFKRCGCPEKHWDRSTGEGCPAWKEYTIPGDEGRKPIIIKDCIDCLSEHWKFVSLKLLEGNQVSIESMRNGLCEQDNDGRIVPKANKGLLALAAAMVEENKAMKAIINGHNHIQVV